MSRDDGEEVDESEKTEARQTSSTEGNLGCLG